MSFFKRIKQRLSSGLTGLQSTPLFQPNKEVPLYFVVAQEKDNGDLVWPSGLSSELSQMGPAVFVLSLVGYQMPPELKQPVGQDSTGASAPAQPSEGPASFPSVTLAVIQLRSNVTHSHQPPSTGAMAYLIEHVLDHCRSLGIRTGSSPLETSSSGSSPAKNIRPCLCLCTKQQLVMLVAAQAWSIAAHSSSEMFQHRPFQMMEAVEQQLKQARRLTTSRADLQAVMKASQHHVFALYHATRVVSLVRMAELSQRGQDSEMPSALLDYRAGFRAHTAANGGDNTGGGDTTAMETSETTRSASTELATLDGTASYPLILRSISMRRVPHMEPTAAEHSCRPFVMIFQGDDIKFSGMNLRNSICQVTDAPFNPADDQDESGTAATHTFDINRPIDNHFVCRLYNMPERGPGSIMCTMALHPVMALRRPKSEQKQSQSQVQADINASEETPDVHVGSVRVPAAAMFPRDGVVLPEGFALTFHFESRQQQPEEQAAGAEHQSAEHISASSDAGSGTQQARIASSSTAVAAPSAAGGDAAQSTTATLDTSGDEDLARRLQAQFDEEYRRVSESRTRSSHSQSSTTSGQREAVASLSSGAYMQSSSSSSLSDVDAGQDNGSETSTSSSGSSSDDNDETNGQQDLDRHVLASSSEDRPPDFEEADEGSLAMEHRHLSSTGSGNQLEDDEALARRLQQQFEEEARQMQGGPAPPSSSAEEAGGGVMSATDARYLEALQHTLFLEDMAEQGSDVSPEQYLRNMLSAMRRSHSHRAHVLPMSTVSGSLIGRECQICKGTFEEGESIKTLPCLHLYHAECIDPWVARRPTCPICLTRIDATPDTEA